jgi:dihydrofolate reductase
MGRTSYAMEDDPNWYADNYEFQVPLFVLTSNPPDPKPAENDKLTWTFVTDGVHSAVTQAKAAAGDRQVTVVGGASTAQQLLAAGLVDEIQLGVLPVILGGGLRLFDNLSEPIRLEKTRVQETGPRTDTWYRVLR